MKTIGFIGLGIMGKPMVLNLLKHGYDVIVNDIMPTFVDVMEKRGAHSAATPSQVAASCEVLITMLPDSPQVKQVIMGENGVLEGAKDGLIILDMSSISPIASREISSACEQKGVIYLDCPVSGGEPKAVDGTLSIMCGGPRNVFENMMKILLCMGASATLVGPVGSGNTTKLVNQVIVAINIAALGEGMSLAVKMGTDPQLVFDAIRGGLAGSTVMNVKMPMILERNFQSGFRIALHIKDLNNTIQSAEVSGITLPITMQVFEMMKSLSEEGMADFDHSALVRYYEKLFDIRIAPPNV